jgi:hypothetical protein
MEQDGIRGPGERHLSHQVTPSFTYGFLWGGLILTSEEKLKFSIFSYPKLKY